MLEKAPSDFVTANRTRISEGDQVIPLAGIWRGARFRDDAEQAKLHALSDAIDDAAGFTPEDHRRVEYTLAPKGVEGSKLTASQREMLRALLGTYFDRVPESMSPLSSYDASALDAVHFA